MRIKAFPAWALLTVLFHACASAPLDDLPALPSLPESALARFLPEVSHQIQEAHRRAQADPQDAQANARLGVILHAYDQFELAAICYQRAHLLHPGSFRWTYYLGLVQAKLGKHREAVATLDKALDLDPDYVPAQLHLAQSFLASYQLGESRTLYEQLVKEHPDLPVAHYGLGQVETALGRTTTAVESYQRACELAPDFGAAHYALALAYRDLKKTARSREHFSMYERNQRVRPPFEDPLFDSIEALKMGAVHHFKAGRALEAAGQIEQAILEYEQALELKPALAQAHANLIFLYTTLSRFEKAEEHYYAAVKTHPNLAEIHYNFGLLLSLQDKYREAIRSFQAAVDINSHYPDAHNNLGHMLELGGKIREAEKHYRLALENNPTHRLAHFNLGRILTKQGRYPQAIHQLLQTLRVQDERTPTFMYVLADAYVRAGDTQKAIHYAQEAMKRAASLGQRELAATIEKDLQELRSRVQ